MKYYKQLLLYSVAGLDRGSAANDAAASEVEIAVSRLQSATSPVVLSWTAGENAINQACVRSLNISFLLGTSLNGFWQMPLA